MRIGFDAKRLYTNFTGLGNYSRSTIDILSAEFPENEYYLYTPRIVECSVTNPFLRNKRCRTFMPHGMLKGSLWRTCGISKTLKEDGIEIYHGLSNEMPMGMFHLNIPTLVTMHDVAFRTFPDMYNWHDRWIYDAKWRYACNNAQHIIAISECTKHDVMKFYNVPYHKIDVVYQPVNRRYYEPLEKLKKGGERVGCVSEGMDFMLYVGSVNSRKNLLGIVKAMEILPRDLQMPLVVVGNGKKYKDEVRRYISEHGMEHLFLWPENVSDRQLLWLYTHAFLFVYPSFYEGFGLPVVEAQLCGCPVVTSNVSSLPEAGGPHALQADPKSREDIADKMKRVLTDSKMREEMIRGGRSYAFNYFHPRVLANQLMDIYVKMK